MTDAWKLSWSAVEAQVGTQLEGPEPIAGAGVIEAEAIRRYLEPLEFDCTLHYDTDVARRYGHNDIIAPYTSVTSFALPPLWEAGQSLFSDPARDAQPGRTNVRPFLPPGAPEISGYFATGMDVDYHRPPRVGDRLTRLNPRLLACEPKETRVGRGAFLTLEADIVDAESEPVATIRSTVYFYEPGQKSD